MAEEETGTIEHKLSLSERREIVESVAAFSSAEGGTILIGVRPDGVRVGVQTGRGSLEGLANEIKQNTDPHTFPRIHIEPEGEKEIVRVEVDTAPVKPVSAYGVPYLRVGRTNQKLTTEAAYELRQQSLGQTWDGLTTLGIVASALPKSNVARFIERLPDSARHSPASILTSMGLEKDGRATNAAVLLFNGALQSKLPQAVIKCAQFEGRASFARNPVTFEGTIVEQIDDALAYVLDRTNRVAITGDARREVRYQYPPDALREAIVNAVCHRDYTQSDPIHIRIYDGRLEI